MTKQIIINEANSLLHRKSKELSKSIIKTPKDLERFAIGLDKLSQDMWDYKNELEAIKSVLDLETKPVKINGKTARIYQKC
ncbi:TPA_asm: hypothetical protein GYJ08_05745 [Listeria monocytogenes]|nr:hypothetical protein [Listeria monocytogenes]EAE4508709.1 hypothetical protein [Listeria monocytogenes]HAA5706088.1 hypothetical protein [Listeria monocytogenes]HAA5718083.1 hypothetical protein [Listeria monocytogenes]HAB6764858.1 hypothetical protein [Listeria monocytogenes]